MTMSADDIIKKFQEVDARLAALEGTKADAKPSPKTKEAPSAKS